MARVVRDTKQELKFEIAGILLFAFAILCLVSIYAIENQTLVQENKAIGTIGSFLVRCLSGLFGKGKYLFIILTGIYGVTIIKEKRTVPFTSRTLGIVLLFGSLLAYLHLKYMVLENTKAILKLGIDGLGGGIIGAFLAIILNAGFGDLGSYVVLATLSLIGVLLFTGTSFATLLVKVGNEIKTLYLNMRQQIMDFLFTTIEEEETKKKKKKTNSPVIVSREDLSQQREEVPLDPIVEDTPLVIIPENPHQEQNELSTDVQKSELPQPQEEKEETKGKNIQYRLPPLSLLQTSPPNRNAKDKKEIAATVKHLEETLESFGVKVKVTQVSCGPAITRYEAQPAPGVKVSKIVSLSDDIALSLAAPHVRIEAPIPGKSAVGIEVPNKEIATVSFREVLETPEFANAPSLLSVAFGKDIAGNPVVADLAKMPHLLIAGATGSGKSVCMNSLICSLLYRCRPDELKFLMIDPKMVELTNYNGIPHLVAPVVTDAKKAATALRWMVNEMENRYALFAANGVRDIYRYNKLKQQEDPTAPTPALPFIVILIDELADLMMVAPADVEDAICRLAQMARAAGMHLVVATQRPSVDVITGVIKANIPSRIAFAVSSQTDSRTILDMGGAEKLLGRGDMLFYPVGMSKPIRVQGVYVSDKEVDRIVNFIKAQGSPEYLQGAEILENGEDKTKDDFEEDELLPEAVRLLLETGHASISLLQRRLHIGYTRAARLIDIMESRGIVGGYEGSKPRNILINWDDYKRMFGEM